LCVRFWQCRFSATDTATRGALGAWMARSRPSPPAASHDLPTVALVEK
jgi:hypothetical protein